MKKTIYMLMMAMLCISTTQAQRMLPGQRGVEFSAGVLPGYTFAGSVYLNVGMTFNGNKGNYGLWALEYAHSSSPYRQVYIPQETYSVEGGYSLQLLGNLRKTITLNAGLTAIVGYETVNRGDTILYDGAVLHAKQGTVYGAGARLSTETYLSDNFVIMLLGRIKALGGAANSRFRHSLGLGVRFNF